MNGYDFSTLTNHIVAVRAVYDVEKEQMTLNISFEKIQEDTLKQMYDIIDCRCVDVLTMDLDGAQIDVWFDDEFLCDGKMPVPTFKYRDDCPPLCGSFMFARHDEEGETIPLLPSDFDKILWKLEESKYKLTMELMRQL